MLIWFVLASGIVNVLLAMFLNVENITSFVLFKAIPFFAGLGAIFFFVQKMNLI